MTYRQLTLEERYQLEAYLRLGLRRAEIAARLGRHPSTITRELARNGDRDLSLGYSARNAARATRQRRFDKGERCRKIRGELRALVEQKLRLSWSPEQIAGRLRVECGIHVSHETIYQHVLRDSRQRGFLRYCLRFGGYKHHRFKKSKVAERTRRRKNWLAQRPRTANERTEVGHWERDCLLGKRDGAAMLTMIDRRSRYTRIRRVQKVDVEHVAAATKEALDPRRIVTKTITNDNGREFQRDAALQRALALLRDLAREARGSWS